MFSKKFHSVNFINLHEPLKSNQFAILGILYRFIYVYSYNRTNADIVNVSISFKTVHIQIYLLMWSNSIGLPNCQPIVHLIESAFLSNRSGVIDAAVHRSATDLIIYQRHLFGASI